MTSIPVPDSRLLDHFLNLRCAPDVLAAVGGLGNRAAKEVTEAMAVVIRASKLLRALPGAGLLDVCSGNALVPVLALHWLGSLERAWALDVKPRQGRHFERVRGFEYVMRDLHELTREMDPPGDGPLVLTCCHGCCDLATAAAELYVRCERVRGLVMMPCCVPQKFAVEARRRYPAEMYSGDGAQYRLWALRLADAVNGTLRFDHRVISPRNALVVAAKDGCPGRLLRSWRKDCT